MSLWRLEALRGRMRCAWGIDTQRLAWQPDAASNAQARCELLAQALPEAASRLTSGACVDVIAGNDLAVHWLQAPPAGLNSLEELRHVAAARCANLYGGAAEDWWVAGDWDARRPFACAALPRAVVAPLQERLRAYGAHVYWHTAWGVMGRRGASAYPPDGWSASRSPARAFLWHCVQGYVDNLSSWSVASDASADEVAAQALQQMELEVRRDNSLTAGSVLWTSACGAKDNTRSEAQAALGLAAMLGSVA